jgi:hypothetical protein
VAELLRRGHTPIAIGRDATSLASAISSLGPIERRVALLDDADGLDRALWDARAVINCAGPFLDTAQPVIEAALRCGLSYFDVTAEQAAALDTFARYDTPARERGIVVVPAAGFYGGLGDVLATCTLGDWTHADRIELGIALDRWWPTAGTRRTGERNTAPRQMLSGGILTELIPSARAPWPFAEPFGTQPVVEVPLTETILIARHLQVRDAHNFLNEAPLRDLRDPATSGPVATDARGRSDQRFVFDVIARFGDAQRRRTIRGRDIYALTAPIIVAAVERFASSEDGRCGAHTLAQLVDPVAFLDQLASRGELELVDSGAGDALSSQRSR